MPEVGIPQWYPERFRPQLKGGFLQRLEITLTGPADCPTCGKPVTAVVREADEDPQPGPVVQPAIYELFGEPCGHRLPSNTRLYMDAVTRAVTARFNEQGEQDEDREQG